MQTKQSSGIFELVLRNYSGPASERKRKEIIKVFKHYDISIQ